VLIHPHVCLNVCLRLVLSVYGIDLIHRYIYIPVPPCMAQSPTNHSPKGTKLGQLEPQQEESKRFFAKGTHLKKNQLFLPEP
jgi:hypothetical protein